MDRYTYYEDMLAEINDIKESIEKLALMTQQEFVQLRGEMSELNDELKKELKTELKADLVGELSDMVKAELVTKLEFREGMNGLRGELKEEIGDLRMEMRAGFAAITGAITNHEYRLGRLEKKADIS